MMKPARCIESRGPRTRAQKGDALLEALIGFVLLMVLGLGLSYATARALKSQRNASTQSIAMNQMRGSLQATGVQALCNGTAAAPVSIKPAQANAQVMALTASSCVRGTIGVGVASNTGLAVSLTGSSTSVVTRMRFATPDDNEVARGLLGDGAMVVSQ